MQSAHSQKRYVAGYLIKAPSDTLRGLLLNEDWKQSPDAIYFKSNAHGTSQKVSAGDETAFHLDANSEHFVAKPVKYHLYRREVDAGEAPVLGTVSDTVFLQQILQGGNLTLYSLLDVRADQRFFLQNQEVFTELVYYTYQRLKDQKRYIEKVMGYKGQLAFFLTGCNTLSFKTLSYTEASITNLLLDYIACMSGDSIKEAPLRKVVLNGSISGGVLVVPSMGVADGPYRL
jgi:hypothetical protein